MGELRWVLLVLGLAVLAGVYLYTRLRPADRERKPPSTRREPVLAESPEALRDVGADEPAPGAAQPAVPLKVVTIRLMARRKPGFGGERLVLALREAGLRHGRFGIFHRLEESSGDWPLFSVASLVEPGSFDLTQLKTSHYPGISLFMGLPGPADGVATFDTMMRVARELAATLEGDLCDESGNTLSIQRERFLREEVIQFQHRQPAPD